MNVTVIIIIQKVIHFDIKETSNFVHHKSPSQRYT